MTGALRSQLVQFPCFFDTSRSFYVDYVKVTPDNVKDFQ